VPGTSGAQGERGEIGRKMIFLLMILHPQKYQHLLSAILHPLRDHLKTKKHSIFLILHQQKDHLAPHLSPLTLCAGRFRRL